MQEQKGTRVGEDARLQDVRDRCDGLADIADAYDVKVDGLKPGILVDYAQREKEVGNARIIKDPATFIFEVTAYEKEGSENVILHDYVSIVFDSYGSKSVLIKDLPVDSYVVVKEAYSGRVYSTDTDKDATILADQNVGVEFENEYEDREPGGGSVTNHFEYTEKDGWVQKEQVDNTEESSEVGEDKTAGNQ